MTDQKLFLRCKNYGKNTRVWRQKFLGLLPEVWKRRLYEKKGYNSIFEFAAKLAGVSKEQVRLVLNLDFRFQDKPALHNLLVNGEASANKLARVASIACNENQEELAEKVQILSQRALDTLVRDERFANSEKISQERNSNQFEIKSIINNLEATKPDSNEAKRIFAEDQHGYFTSFSDQNSLPKPFTDHKVLCAQEHNEEISENSKININRDLALMSHLPNSLKDRLEKFIEKGIDIGQLVTDLLDKHEEAISAEKEQLATTNTTPTNSRYISVKIKRVLQKENGTKCSIPNCSKPVRTIHHTNRFSLSHSHDPRYLAPICHEHHEIAHSIDLKFYAFHTHRHHQPASGGSFCQPRT